MFKNYLKVALRSLYSNRLQSAINIIGMTIGLSCCLLIALFVIDESGYDRFFPDAERIYRVSRDTFVGTSFESREATNAPQVAELLENNFPEVEVATRANNMPVLIRRDNAAFYENYFLYADNNFFEIFAFEWLQGNPGQALLEPFSVVLTESMAEKYFSDENPLNQTLLLNNEFPLRVTGIIRDLPHNTHLRAEGLISINTLASSASTENALEQWGNNSYHTYVRLAPGVAIGTLEAQFPALVERFMGPGTRNPEGLEMSAINIRDIHLHSDKDYELKPGGNMAAVISASVIALCILLIASVNFMNLSTARYTQRAKEVGLRKTLGAERLQLVHQFLLESLLLIVISFLLSLMLTEFLLPAFSAFVGRELSLGAVTSAGTVVLLVIFVTGIALLTGSYPAFFLSSFNPGKVLKSNFSRRDSSATLRNALVVLQFSIAIVLLVATSVVFFQMRYANDVAQNFDREMVVVLTAPDSQGVGPQWPAMKQMFLSHPAIIGVTASDQVPLNTVDRTGPLAIEGREEVGRTVPRMHLDYDFFQTYGIDVVAGRPFLPDRNDALQRADGANGAFSRNYMINETAAREFGWTPEEAIGKQIAYLFVWGNVVGVVEDSFFESLKDAIKPMVYFLAPPNDPLSLVSIRISGADIGSTLAFIDSTWQDFMPEYPVQRRFLDDDFNALYQSETQQGELFRYFAVLAMLIACFGLIGLATFIVERRTKEIGVRKVMGGSVWSIVLLLTNDFSKLVLISNLIAWPVAWYAMNRWLENFAYRIDLTPMIFIGSGLIALCIAWVTVGGTAAKAASQKPVLALRYE